MIIFDSQMILVILCGVFVIRFLFGIGAIILMVDYIEIMKENMIAPTYEVWINKNNVLVTICGI